MFISSIKYSKRNELNMMKKVDWKPEFDVFFEAHEKLKQQGAKLSVYDINE